MVIREWYFQAAKLNRKTLGAKYKLLNKVGMVKFDTKGEIGKELKFPPPIKVGPVFMLHF